MRGAPQSPLVPVGPDFLNYLSVNADKELTRRLVGVGSPHNCGQRLCMCPRGPEAAQAKGV